ncbi:MAG TPA: histidine phosphatase family protein, partial [Devosia sp.]|nr:histidine phosphatase family protein [Devosia sp.]
MTDWPELFFARHGETDWNRERRYQGQRDIPLNPTGRGQADAIGPLLVDLLAANDLNPAEIDWFASPLSRARETMERMRDAFNTPLPEIVYDDRLQEISFGVMEGKLHSELASDI